MKRNTIAAVLALGGVALVPGAPALAAPSQSQPLLQQQARDSHQLPVIPASQVVGRKVVDSQGHDAGRIRSLIIDTDNGSIEYVLIGSRGSFNIDDNLVVVPWPVLHGLRGNGAVQVNVSANKLQNGPLVNQRAIQELNQPKAVQRIYGYYGYHAYGAGYGGYGFGGGYPRGGSPYPVRHYPGSGMAYGYYGGRYNPVPPTIQYGGNGNGTIYHGNTAKNGNNGHPGLSVNANGVVSALTSPEDMSPNALRSITVHARNGSLVGDIDQVVIDPVHGMVAFVLVKRGGFLGLNPTWFALPVQALRWSSYRGQYQLTVNEQQLNNIPPVPANSGNLANHVNRHALAQLYSDFNVSPYWQSGSQQQSASG